MVDIASRIAALYPEDRALIESVLEAVEAKELVAKARGVLGIVASDEPASWRDHPAPDVVGTDAPDDAEARAAMCLDGNSLHIEPIRLGTSPGSGRRYRMCSGRRAYLCEYVDTDGRMCDSLAHLHGRCKLHRKG